MQSILHDFWTKHRFLIICAAAYVIVCIISCFYNPWDTIMHFGNRTIVIKSDAAEDYVRSVDIDNRFFDKIPLKFLSFGIADVAECVHDEFGILCGFIAYVAVFIDYLIKKYYKSNEDAGKFEIFISCYLCDNIIFYVMSIFAKLFENTTEVDFFNFLMIPFDTFDSKIFIIPVIIFLIICVFIILPLFLFAVPPTFVTYYYFFIYLAIYKICTNLIENINDKIMQNGKSLFLELIMFILASLIIVTLNLLLAKLFEIIRGWSLKFAKVYINLMKKTIQKFRSRR